MPLPLVTTVLPVRNRAGLLREAVTSVLSQTYRPIELIISDDGSTDETARVADQLAAQDSFITVLHQPNRGPGAARETGRLAARGEYIQYLDSDDLLYPEKFELQVAALEANPDCGAAYGWTRFRRADGSCHPTPWKRTGEAIGAMFPAFLQSRWWDTSTPLYRRSLIDAAGPWTSLRMEEDWEYDARIAALGTRLCYVPQWVSETRVTEGSLAAGNQNQGPRELADRARAHMLIHDHAVRAGIRNDTPEMKHFARELFLLSRQCGAAGLEDESRMLFELSRKASGDAGDDLQFRIYERFAKLAGWNAAGRAAAAIDRLRRRR